MLSVFSPKEKAPQHITDVEPWVCDRKGRQQIPSSQLRRNSEEANLEDVKKK